MGKNLDQLEGTTWGEPQYGSSLVRTCHALRTKPVDEFTAEDLRIMIGQGIGLPHLVPRALEVLAADPLAAGRYYPGDLLQALVGAEAWVHAESDHGPAVSAVAAAALHRLGPDDTDLARSLRAYLARHPGGRRDRDGEAARRPFEPAAASAVSAELAAQLLDRCPALGPSAALAWSPSSTTWELALTHSAPSGDPAAALAVWVEEGATASVGFGRWHTHEDTWAAHVGAWNPRAAILDLVCAVLSDRVVLLEEAAGPGAGAHSIVDLGGEDALLEYLTDRHASGRARLRSWSGALDRDLSLDDSSLEVSGSTC